MYIKEGRKRGGTDKTRGDESLDLAEMGVRILDLSEGIQVWVALYRPTGGRGGQGLTKASKSYNHVEL